MAWGDFYAVTQEHVCMACRPCLFSGVVAGYVRVWLVSVSGQVRGRERGKDDLKSSSSFALHVQGKKENNVIQNDTILGFFFNKRK